MCIVLSVKNVLFNPKLVIISVLREGYVYIKFVTESGQANNGEV